MFVISGLWHPPLPAHRPLSDDGTGAEPPNGAPAVHLDQKRTMTTVTCLSTLTTRFRPNHDPAGSTLVCGRCRPPSRGKQGMRSDGVSDRRDRSALWSRSNRGAVALAFAVGIVMSVNSSRHIGEDGNLLLSHGRGVHGLQAVPVVALLVSLAATTPPATRSPHAAGVAGLPPAAPPSPRDILGTPPLQPSPATVLVVAGLSPVGCRRQPHPPDLAPDSPHHSTHPEHPNVTRRRDRSAVSPTSHHGGRR